MGRDAAVGSRKKSQNAQKNADAKPPGLTRRANGFLMGFLMGDLIDFNREGCEGREARKGIKSYFSINHEMNDFRPVLFFASFASFAVDFRTPLGACPEIIEAGIFEQDFRIFRITDG
jgi:hypothetical protein